MLFTSTSERPSRLTALAQRHSVRSKANERSVPGCYLPTDRMESCRRRLSTVSWLAGNGLLRAELDGACIAETYASPGAGEEGINVWSTPRPPDPDHRGRLRDRAAHCGAVRGGRRRSDPA